VTDELWSTRRTSFGSAADAYAAGRPSYPEDALEWVLRPSAARVLDLAAGTGRLSEQLLARGLEVVAVEPDDAMRDHVPSAATALAGTAEDIPLDDASVDAIVVGQAFHWFDVPHAMPEIRRVLRPGGTLGLFWNLLDDRDRLVDQICDLLIADERASSMQADQSPPYSDIEGLADPKRRLFADSPTYDADRLVAFLLSRSRTILMADDDRDRLLDRARALAPHGEFAMPLVCEAWRGERH
jgi:SAM-dependent methyltransferase